MKLIKNALGISAAGVLAIAVLGGAVGGTLALRSDSADQQRTVQLNQVADETAPSASPSPTMEAEPAPVVEPAEEAPMPAVPTKPAPAVSAPVADPAPADRAESAADRAEAAASKSEKAAERAEEAAEEVAPVAAPTKAAEPVKPKSCDGAPDGSTVAIPYRGDFTYTGGQAGERTCVDGKWVVTKKPVDGTPPPKPELGPTNDD